MKDMNRFDGPPVVAIAPRLDGSRPDEARRVNGRKTSRDLQGHANLVGP